ncbi:hemin-degrading factor [Reyranella massiliensis]|uniref:hemin-degrading factor n=1 Tax=Reyranella massiliensis TaxID=445220 RepID=UPI0005C29B1C|nr:hemin-degrading factor [Reyranella massiliensis]
MLSTQNADLAARWSRLRGEQPAMRIRDAATTLGVSEAELVALGIGQTATPLTADWRGILNDMPSVGRVMCLTRNEHCVHERHGRFEDVQVTGPHGLVLGTDIDLRLFLGSWKHGFAVREPLKQGERLSLQFFDAAGEAVHKIYAIDETDRPAFDALIARFTAAEPRPLKIAPHAPNATDRPDAEIDLDGLRKAWAGMKDTHEFFGMLGKFKVGRVQALRLIGEEFSRELPVRALREAMEAARQSDLPIMIFVGSRGCIQIHTGPVKRLVDTHGWFNVLDPDFNLHLRDSGVARVFSVRKPTEDGLVTSIEAFDAENRNILLMFGARKPGKPELEDWRAIVAHIEKQAAS